MNISDVDLGEAKSRLEISANTDEPLALIFWRQTELSVIYAKVESRNGNWWPDRIPTDLHDARSQTWLKDMTYRVIEEIVETYQAIEQSEPTVHVWEELADGLHFITELMIYSGLTHVDVLSPLHSMSAMVRQIRGEITHASDPTILRSFMEGVIRLGWAMHRLKDKPWKTTQVLTDVREYKVRLIAAYWAYITLCVSLGLDDESILDNYIRKSEVNLFRMRSNY